MREEERGGGRKDGKKLSCVRAQLFPSLSVRSEQFENRQFSTLPILPHS